MANLQGLLQGHLEPDVMAVRASVFNGVRSATITRELVSKETMATLDSLLRDPPQIPIDMRLLLSLVGAFGLLGEGSV